MEYENIYFIGIGGIGMSALARYFHTAGSVVSGSDLNETELIVNLKEEGINVNLNQEARNLGEKIDCVVYTVAIPPDNPELLEAQRRGLPLFTYAEMLGQISKDSFTIAVAGTHGKTTTTAMIGEVFRSSQRKPNLIVGSLLAESHSNFVPGEEEDAKIFIVEACEYARSFLNLHPNILVITNIEEDHLDYYKDLAEIQEAFLEMASKVPEDGYIVCHKNLPNLLPIVEKFPEKILDYSEFVSEVPVMKVFGEHNILNAEASLGVAKIFNLEPEKSRAGLKNFKGTWRRLEFKKELQNGALLYDDYGHHPAEISATLNALRGKYPDKKILTVFQPHLYSRTKIFLEDFSKVLAEKSDFSLIYPIFAAREKDDGSISSEILTNEICLKGGRAEFVKDFSEVVEKISELNQDWIVLLLGAGDLYKISTILN